MPITPRRVAPQQPTNGASSTGATAGQVPQQSAPAQGGTGAAAGGAGAQPKGIAPDSMNPFNRTIGQTPGQTPVSGMSSPFAGGNVNPYGLQPMSGPLMDGGMQGPANIGGGKGPQGGTPVGTIGTQGPANVSGGKDGGGFNPTGATQPGAPQLGGGRTGGAQMPGGMQAGANTSTGKGPQPGTATGPVSGTEPWYNGPGGGMTNTGSGNLGNDLIYNQGQANVGGGKGPQKPYMPQGTPPPGSAYLQSGGPAKGGRPYVVGEAGPEVFVPDEDGQVIPNDAFDWRKGDRGPISPSLEKRLSRPHKHVISNYDVASGLHSKEELAAQNRKFFGPPENENVKPDFSSVDYYPSGNRGRPYEGINPDTGQPYTYAEAYKRMLRFGLEPQ